MATIVIQYEIVPQYTLKEQNNQALGGLFILTKMENGEV